MSPLSLLPVLLLLFLVTAQGIRFGPMSISSSDQRIHEEKEGNSVEGSGVKEVVICRDGHCSGSRKLLSNTMSTTSEQTEQSKGEKIEQSKGENIKVTSNNPSTGEVDHNREDFSVKSSTPEHQQPNEKYPDIVDIAGMDYSPAKRKPPIHN